MAVTLLNGTQRSRVGCVDERWAFFNLSVCILTVAFAKMGCCSNKTGDDENKCGMVPSSERK